MGGLQHDNRNVRRDERYLFPDQISNDLPLLIAWTGHGHFRFR